MTEAEYLKVNLPMLVLTRGLIRPWHKPRTPEGVLELFAIEAQTQESNHASNPF